MRYIYWKIRTVAAARISIGEWIIPSFGSICLVGNIIRIAGPFGSSLTQIRHFLMHHWTLFSSGSCTVMGQSRDKAVRTVAKGIVEREEKEPWLA